MKQVGKIRDDVLVTMTEREWLMLLSGGFMGVDLGETIRLFRRKHDLSQQEFAERAHLSRTYISLIERGMANVSQEVVEKVMYVLGADVVEQEPRTSVTALHKAVVRSVDAGFGNACALWLLLRSDNDGGGVVPFDRLDQITAAAADGDPVVLAYAEGENLFWTVDEERERVFLKSPATVLQVMEQVLDYRVRK